MVKRFYLSLLCQVSVPPGSNDGLFERRLWTPKNPFNAVLFPKLIFIENHVLEIQFFDNSTMRNVRELTQELLEGLEKHVSLENVTLVLVPIVVRFNPLQPDVHIVDKRLNSAGRTSSLVRGRISFDFFIRALILR